MTQFVLDNICYQAPLATIDARYQKMVETLIAWANINSGSYHLAGIDAYREQLVKAFQPLLDANDELSEVELPAFEMVDRQGHVVLQSVAKGLLVRKRPSAKRRVVLCGHMDTVYGKDHGFQSCWRVDENTLNGPGVADMKGGIVVMLAALLAFECYANAAQIGWDVYLCPDEEIGSQSSATVFSRFRQHTFAMIYEPSLPAGEFVGRRKGSGNFTLVVRGQASHAGREFFKGRNAIAKLSAIIGELHALNDFVKRDALAPTLNIGTITGGQALNVIPDLAITKFNIRVSNDAAAADILARVDEIMSKHRDGDYEIARHGVMTRPSKPMDSEQKQLFAFLQQSNDMLDLPTKVMATGGCCDGNNFKALGVPNIDTLGVRGAHIHSDQEYVLLDSLCERAKLSALLLMRFADGKFTRETADGQI